MAESQSVPGLMQRDAEQIHATSDLPSLGVIEMHISRDRFRVNWKRVKGVCQNTGSEKWISISVRAGGEQDTDSLICVRVVGGREGDLDNVGPFGERACNFSFGGARR